MEIVSRDESASRGLPDGATYLLVNASPAVLAVQREHADASGAYERARTLWRKRLFTAQCAIAGVLFIKWALEHSVVAAAFMTILPFAALTVLQVFVGAFVRGEKRQMTDASTRLAAARQREVEHYLESLALGRYRWIRRNGDYLAVLPDAGLLYVFESTNEHLLIDARSSLRAVRVATHTHRQQTATTTTTHGRRLVVSTSGGAGMIGKGKSTSETTITETVTTEHVLEIQIQPAPGAQPVWFQMSFGEDGRTAEDWKLLVRQLQP